MGSSSFDGLPENLRRALEQAQHDDDDWHTNSTNNLDDNNDDVLVIGIDFGTTFSGVAWATAADFASDQVNIITSWPGTGREEGKAPTEIFYEYGEMSWGYLVPSDGDPVRWFKLLLVKEEDLDPSLRSSEFLLRARQFLRVEGKTAIDLITDYLRALWGHVLQTIVKARGQAVIDALRFHVVVTVPAIWQGYARQDMKQAAQNAGILDARLAGDTILSFAPEPEAAALSTLCEPGRKVNKGDVFMVCDAGGGTVDLITYKISNASPIMMEEAVEGTGGLCGGIFIDQAFQVKCQKCLGRRWDRLSKNDINDVMREDWERGVKPQFTPSLDRDYPIRVPAGAFANGGTTDTKCDPIIKNARMMFTKDHIREIFGGVFANVDKLVDGQIQSAKAKSLSGIILVGGFGASPYLYEHLRDRYKAAGIDILQSGGMRPRTAICRGAVFKGFLDSIAEGGSGSLAADTLPIKVTSTISRASYGSQYKCTFIPGTHKEADKEWDEDECTFMASRQMAWYLKRGDEISTKDTVRHSFYHTYRRDFGDSITVNLYHCDEKIPPSSATASVKLMCSIDCKVGIPFAKLIDYRNPQGEKLKRLEFDIEMVPSGASLEFNVYMEGRKLGGSNVAVNFQ
ncbi:putative Actin-like ATPase domain-containing protein [Seiridium unicorne]|uniref:Actin-like ATPase domain-containing protein n=1 Tax=Seiridium unicorne TaxID=138068 RepID=A0ABR2UDX1_9PEZI